MKVVKGVNQQWKLTDDGFCAYCEAYRACWLSDCTNPIHAIPEEELTIVEVQP